MSSSQFPKRSSSPRRDDAVSRWSTMANVQGSDPQGDRRGTVTADPRPTYDAVAEGSPSRTTVPRRTTSRPPHGLLPWIKWSYSLLLPLAVVLALGTWIWQVTRADEGMELTIVGAPDSAPVADATVFVGGEQVPVSSTGTVEFAFPTDTTSLRIEAPGFHAVDGRVNAESAAKQTIALQPNSKTGVLTDELSGTGLGNVSVVALDGVGNEVTSTATDADGNYRLDNLPITGTIIIEAGSYGRHSVPIEEDPTLDLALTLRTASGVVTDGAGNPVQGAVVQSGEVTAVTAGDGTYTLEGVNQGDEVSVRASGFEAATAQIMDGQVPDVQLANQMVKAVYANYNTLTSEDGLDALIEIANTTEINAIVIDVKEGVIFYDSAVPFFNEVGTVRPAYDLEAILAKLTDNNIYAIARMVVFQDPLVAEARPDLAVQDVNGGLWVNVQGVGWVSAFHEELWEANIDLAVELVERGFDEVQYDYVRFPSDGDLSTADFGREYTAEAREAAITEFMRRSHEAVGAAGGYLAADLFGFVTIMDDEQYIGQRFSALAPHLDFVCMMIYPSHFETGNIASAPGHPNDYPYETIFESLERADAIVPDSRLKFRPWLQDFSYGFNGLRDYTPADVRAQMDAAEDFGASGWMLWGDPENVTVEALEPEPGG